MSVFLQDPDVTVYQERRMIRPPEPEHARGVRLLIGLMLAVLFANLAHHWAGIG